MPDYQLIAALYSNRKCVTGSNHGDAASKLKEKDKDDCTSGFLDPNTGRFITENKAFFMKQMICIRHAEYETPFLTTKGIIQAKHTAEFLSQLDLTDYSGLSSPYRRCQQTSAIIAAFTGIRFYPLDCLGEQCGPETSSQFHERITKCIEHLPEKSIMVTHFDTIIETVQIAVGQTPNNQWRIPHASITYLDQAKLVWLGKQIKNE